MRKQVLVFDSSGGYQRYFKINFPVDITIVNFFKFHDPATIDFDKYDAAIVLISEVEELIDLLWFCGHAPIVFVGSYAKFANSRYFRDRLRKFENIIALDLNKPKLKVLEHIMFYLDASPEEQAYFTHRSAM